jgi:hypothetical protein
MFGVVSRNFFAARHPFRKRVSGCIQSTSFCHRNHFFVFRNEHAQSTTLGPKLMFGVVSRNFVAACHPFRKRVSGCIQSTSFCHRNHFFIFRNKHAPSTTLGPKLMFGVISRNFIAAHHPFRKRVSGCIQSTSFCHENHFFIFLNKHAQSTTLGDRAGVPDLSVSGDNSDLVEVDPHDPTTTNEPEAPMQSLNQLPMVTDLAAARSA